MKLNQQAEYTNPSFLQKIAEDLIKSRKSNYPEDCIYYYFQQNKFTMEDLPNLKNKYNNLLKCTLVRHRLSLLQKVQQDFALNNDKLKNNNKINPLLKQKCIVYLHGLGSNRLQGLSLLSHMPKNYSLLTFDLSGSGKSQGQYTTYGYREKQDIQAVLLYLYKYKDIRNFIIWGRSMGAVATLLFNNLMAQKQNQTIYKDEQAESSNNKNINISQVYNCINFIVADSPFYSFEEISKEIALKKMSIPTFFTDIALKVLQKMFDKFLYDKKTKKNYTPFQIDFLKNPLTPVVPIVFIYSLNDQVVNCDHSQNIIKSIDKSKLKFIEKIIIPQCGHNIKRPQNVMEAVFLKIERHLSNLYKNNSNQNQLPYQNSKQSIQINQNLNSSINKTNNSSINKTNETLQQRIKKSIRKKSYWNFQEEFLNQSNTNKQTNNQHQKPQNDSKVELAKNGRQTLEKSVKRRSIFNRQQQDDICLRTRNNPSTKKRGLSLSSTIQRGQRNQKELKDQSMPKKSIQMKQNIDFSLKKSLINNHNRLRNHSMEIKPNQPKLNPCIQVTNMKKNSLGNSIQIMNDNFQSSSRKRPSLGGNKKQRVFLGGSVQKQFMKRQHKLRQSFDPNKFNSKQSSSFIKDKLKENHQQPAQRDINSNRVFMSTISYNNSKDYLQYTNQDSNISLKSKLHKQTLKSCVQIQNVQSQPNIINSEQQQLQFRRLSTKQSLKTIDIGILNCQSVDEEMALFINKKLQLNLDKFNWNNEETWRNKEFKSSCNKNQTYLEINYRQKIIELGGSPRKNDKSKNNKNQPSDLDKKQKPQCKNSPLSNNKFNIPHTSAPAHITLRPSSRLFHQKRKKKLQNSHYMNQKIDFNTNANFVKITNQRYLLQEC